MKNSIRFFIVFSSFLFGEFDYFQIPNISSQRILSICQDSAGYVWIGTDEGLNRFDGYSNKVYRSNIYDEHTISGNRVWISFIDQNNTLWVGTDRGVCYYNEREDKFYRIKTGSRPLHYLETDSDIYFTTSNNGILSISKSDKKVTRFQFDPLDPFSLSSSKFSDDQSSPIIMNDSLIWVGTINGLNVINKKSNQITRFYSKNNSALKSDKIKSLLISKGKIYIGSDEGLGITNLNDAGALEDVLSIEFSSPIIRIFAIEENNFVGVITKNDIKIFSQGKIIQNIPIKAPLESVKTLENGEYLLTSNYHKNGILLILNDSSILDVEKINLPITPRKIFVDNEEGIWLAGDEGLHRSSNIASPVSKQSLIKLYEEHISRSKNKLYYIRNKKLYLFDGNSNVVRNIDADENSLKNLKLYVSNDENIYLFDKHLFSLEKNNKLKRLAKFDLPINTMYKSGDDVFVSIKNSGIAHLGHNNGKINDFRKNRLLSEILPPGASTFYIDESTLWIGNDESGLHEVDISNPILPKLIKHHIYEQSNPNSFESSSVSCIHKYAELLFVGTNGDGIFILNKDKFDKINIEHGLPSNNIISFAESSDSTVWVLTNGGLVLLNWLSKDISIIGSKEGLAPFYKNRNSLLRSNDEGAFVISPGLVQKINKDKIFINEFETNIAIESVQLIDKQNKKRNVNKNNLKVTHMTPIIRINYTSPAIYKSDHITFSYFIDGYHNSWIFNEDRRYVEIQGLGPGKYTFNIKAFNSDGFESTNIQKINFQIYPPWWKTIWAYFFYVLATLFVVAYYVKYQKETQAKVSEEKRKEEELEQARKFQLDMLPKETPEYLGLDISSTIKTASEVGGDYFDYFPQKDEQSLYVVVGDATGHGMTAGMMVSITKAGLYGIPPIPPNKILKRLNRVIKNIDLGLNRMAVNIAKFHQDKVELTSAAMPPIYHYNGATKEVNEILIEGLPLGSFMDENFDLLEISFKKQDSLIFISDGLPEATNSEGELIGYDPVYNCIKQNGHLSASEQKKALLDLGSSWLGDIQNQDDITIVVVKKE